MFSCFVLSPGTCDVCTEAFEKKDEKKKKTEMEGMSDRTI